MEKRINVVRITDAKLHICRQATKYVGIILYLIYLFTHL